MSRTPVYELAETRQEAITLLMSGVGYFNKDEAVISKPNPDGRLKVWRVDRRVSEEMVLDD